MNLEDAKIATSVVDATVLPDEEKSDDEVCPICEVPGSENVDGKCDICGAVWPDDEMESDLNIALDLLISCRELFASLMSQHNMQQRLGSKNTQDIKNLGRSVEDFLEDWDFED